MTKAQKIARACENLRKLRGRVKLDIDLELLREDRRFSIRARIPGC